MPYEYSDQSAHAGQPIELYLFEGPSASLTYRYTSYPENVVYSGDTYLAVPIERGVVAGSTTTDSPELTITIPASTPLAAEYVFKTPPRSLDVTIYRMHSVAGTPTEYWKGEITAFNVQGARCVLRSPSLMDDPMRRQIPSTFYQGICNHVLYGNRCRVSDVSWERTSTITTISGNTVTVASVGTVVDGELDSGKIVRDSDGESRMILRSVGTLMTLSYPFRELAGTDAVTFYDGCGHTVEECRDHFDNVVNYGGFPYIPNVNPFLSGFKPTGS